MQRRFLIVILLLAGMQVGCTWLRDSWPWGRKEVPITEPSEIADVSYDDMAAVEDRSPRTLSQQPALEPAADIPLLPLNERTTGKKLVTPQPPAPVPAETPAKVEQPLPTKSVAPASRRPVPLEVSQPTMLENIVADAEPIATADVIYPSRRKQPVSSGLDTPGQIIPRLAKPKPMEDRLSAMVPDQEPTVIPAETKPRLIPLSPKPAQEAFPTKEVLIEPIAEPKAPNLLPKPQKIEYGKEEVVAASLLQVNNTFLTVDDILQAARRELSAIPASLSSGAFDRRSEQIIRQTISGKIVETLVLAEANNRLTDQQKERIEEELETRLEKLVAETGGSRKKLESVLVQRGTDLESVIKEERNALISQVFLQERFFPAITVTRTMLWDYYRANQQEFTTPAKVQMQVIAAPYDKFADDGSARTISQDHRAATDKAREIIDQAAEALKTGQRFEEVAKRLSRGIKADSGGIWPMMAAGSFRERAVEEAAFALNEGQVSEVIKTDSGFYIVKAKRVIEGQVVSFPDAQEQIDKKLRQEQVRKLEQTYFQRLSERAYISEPDEFLPIAVQQAAKLYRQ